MSLNKIKKTINYYLFYHPELIDMMIEGKKYTFVLGLCVLGGASIFFLPGAILVLFLYKKLIISQLLAQILYIFLVVCGIALFLAILAKHSEQ